MIGRSLAALAALLSLSAQRAPQEPMVTTEGGRLSGLALSGGVDAYLGIPFAAPPVRDLRWKPPQPAASWTGIRHADRFAPECLQPLRSPRQNHYFGEEATSEDCLYLNIWAPRGARRAPVVVWIYGGGFTIGSASMANYSGEPLARDGVVRVNLAYRVGALGFMALPDLARESGYGASGNYGLMDQIAALRWVKRNIARFGGDPDNVTIVGQSAGSMSVALLQMSPPARGLFQRAVGMSGSPFGGMLGPASRSEAEAAGTDLAGKLGARTLADLRAVPGDRIVAAQGTRVAIAEDGRYVTGPAERVFAVKAQADVPILIGYTRDESFRPFERIADRRARRCASGSGCGPTRSSRPMTVVTRRATPPISRATPVSDGRCSTGPHIRRGSDGRPPMAISSPGDSPMRRASPSAIMTPRRWGRITPVTCPIGSARAMRSTCSGRPGIGSRATLASSGRCRGRCSPSCARACLPAPPPAAGPRSIPLPPALCGSRPKAG